MQAGTDGSNGNKYPMNFVPGVGNVHIEQGDFRNNLVHRTIAEGQRFTRATTEFAMREFHDRSRKGGVTHVDAVYSSVPDIEKVQIDPSAAA